MSARDHYSTLGVLPEAEAIVITAAYRALAQRYHPDKSPGDPAEAHRRMAEINEAYRVLGNEELRAEYDATRKKEDHADYKSAESDESSEAFSAALRDLEERWELAVDIFPDLAVLRTSLSKLSTSLAFSFVTVLLDSKKYNHRSQIATGLERHFLQRYFGSNEIIIAYAKELVQEGHREAARTLNRVVDVMGSEIDPNLVVQRIEKQFSIHATRLLRQGLESLAKSVRDTGYFTEACQLAELLGYKIEERSTGFLGAHLSITVVSPKNETAQFHSKYDFVEWTKKKLC